MSDHADDAVGIVHALGWKYGCSTYYHAPRHSHWKENANNDPFPPQEPEWYDDSVFGVFYGKFIQWNN